MAFLQRFLCEAVETGIAIVTTPLAQKPPLGQDSRSLFAARYTRITLKTSGSVGCVNVSERMT